MSWPMVKLGSLFKVTSGGTPSRAVAEYYEDGQIPWVKTGDLHNKYVEQASEYITEAGLKFSSTRLYPVGTVLVAMYGATIGACSILAIEACTNQACAAFTPNPNVDVDYLYYFLKHSKAAFVNAGAGGAQPNISAGFLKDYEIPLPPLAEQKRIAAILDKADAVRRKRQQAIQLADDFLRAVFLEMFGDPVTNPKNFPIVKLGNLCEDLFLGLTSKVDYIDSTEGFPLVRAKDINTGELCFDEVKYISKEQHRKLTKNHLTRKGDLLVSKSGTLGTCAIVRTDREFSTYESIFTVRPYCNRLDIYYLIHLLQNKGFKEKLLGNKVGGTVAHLNLKMFRDFEIGIPPIELQKTFADTILKCEKKLDAYRQSNQHADELFTAISQKAFSGQL